MKTTKNILKILLLLTLSSFIYQTSAEYRVYDNVSEFEKAKWAICEAATDWCNNYFMTNGKVMWGTKMFCQDQKVEWTCTKLKEWSVTTLWLPMTTWIENSTASENDINLHKHLRKNIKSSYQNKVDTLVNKIEARAWKMSPLLQERYYDKWINKIDSLISKLLMKYPADITLPKKANTVYQVLELLKLEIDLNLKLNVDLE